MEKKKRKMPWWGVLLIVLGAIVLTLALFATAGYFILQNMFEGMLPGGAPAVNVTADASALVTVTGGQLSGGVDNGIYTFLGVPYAEATERFKPASPVTPWEGVREATAYGAISPQNSFFGGSDGQDNNCQNLNLWTPALNDGGKRPVLVWFHGGGITSGSANEGTTNGRNLAEKEDVVVVTVNHRLGVLGFLDLSDYGEEYAESGNVGLLDMVAALQWVHDNIEQFGGDPDNVTIFGQSGGGAKVLALMTTPRAKGLFHKAVNQSGATVVLGPIFATKDEMRRVTELTMQGLGITDPKELESIPFDRLNAVSANAINQVAAEFGKPGALGSGNTFEWMPVVDGDIVPTHPLTEDGFADAGFAVPLLIGTNLNEWAFGFGINANLSEEEVLTQLRSTYGDDAEAVFAAFKTAYPDVPAVNALYVDRFLRPAILEITKHKAMQNGAPVYSYVMTYGNPSSTHGTEIPLVFANGTGRMNDTMSAIWAQFARTGNPSVDGIPAWEPYTIDGGATMLLDENSTLTHHHDEELMALVGWYGE